jgi:hypothetical protein
MNRSIVIAVLLLVQSLLLSSSGTAQKSARNRYHVIVVELFTVQDGVDFPLDYLATMQEELMTQVKKDKVFTEVLRPGEKPSDPKAPIIQLDGVVTEFHPGSRTKRYVLGPGFGKTKIVAHIRFWDPASDSTFLEKFVDGKVIMGFIGGESIGATRGLAKEVSKDARKVF